MHKSQWSSEGECLKLSPTFLIQENRLEEKHIEYVISIK